MQPRLLHPLIRLAQQVIALESQQERLEKTLHAPHGDPGASHVLEKDHRPAGPQHAPDLANRCCVVGDAAERERGDDGVEGRVREGQALRVRDVEVNSSGRLLCPAASEVEDCTADVDANEANARGVVRQVATRADGDLEDVTVGLARRPLPATGEQQSFRQLDHRVVPTGNASTCSR